MPPPNMSFGHIDCFELKLLKKQPVQERHSDPFFVPLKARNTSPI